MVSVAAIVQGIGQGTRLLCFLQSILSLLTWICIDTLPGRPRPFELTVNTLLSRPWAYLTSGLVEVNPALLLLSLLGAALAGRYFEKIWGLREFLKFVLIVNAASVLLTTMTVFFEYMFSQQNENLLYGTHSSGQFALLSGFLVAFKQAIPEHSLNIAGLISIRVKHIPSSVVFIAAILRILGVLHAYAFMAIYGTIVSWIFIRFFKSHDGLKGDRSESFSFGSFFPPSTHWLIMPISNSTYNFLVSIQLLPKLGPPPLPQTTSDMRSSIAAPALPGLDAAEAERRRAIALKALDMRLNETAAAATITATSTSTSTTNTLAAPGSAHLASSVPIGSTHPANASSSLSGSSSPLPSQTQLPGGASPAQSRGPSAKGTPARDLGATDERP